MNKTELTMPNGPLISVLFPVYNGGVYLEDAVQSILCQTYENIELIIINDGSFDNSVSIIQKFKDHRIQLYNQTNQGLAATLNRAIKLAKGEFLARQDADDISFPERFEKQVAFLKSYPSVGMVGTWAEIWDKNKKTKRSHKHPSENLILKFELLFDSPFVHSSMMIRKNVFDKIGLYSTDRLRQPPEDYELWCRVAREFEVANIPEILHIYREIPGSMSRIGPNPFLERLLNMSAENIAWVTGRDFHDPDITDLAALAHSAYHRVSPNPDFPGIYRVLFKAANKLIISSGSENPELMSRAKARLQIIRRNYLEYKIRKMFSVIFR
jgi:glycosyltransferase involved in cell wall biosynthesis